MKGGYRKMAITISVSYEGMIPPSDITNNPQVVESCNMFSIEALEKSLTYMTVKNYWSLYDIQKRKIGIKRFDISFSEFKLEYRLPTEKEIKMYSRRYVYYTPIQFIDYVERKRYKRSAFYNNPVDMNTVSDHPEIYDKNFLIFIDGRFISTAEIVPLEDKTAIILDVASSNDYHGIPLKKYREYRETNPIVTVFFIPNFTWAKYISNRYAMVNNKFIIPYTKFNRGECITKDSLMLINTTNISGKTVTSLRKPTIQYRGDFVNKRFIFNESILNEFDDASISDEDDMISSYDFLVLNFNKLFRTIRVDSSGYFKIQGKMPCPRENMLVFSILKNGDIVFDDSLTVDLYYPNIYHIVNGNHSECTYLVYCFYDDNIDTKTEEYANQIALYEQYVDVLNKYVEGNIPEVLKDWYPSNYAYGNKDYDSTFNHFHIPNTLLYKVFKMYDTIAKDPWALKAYLNFLLCPSEKYYIDVTKLKLPGRLRTDTTPEPIVNGTHYVFSEPHYVFAMNRRYLKRSRYDFRIWVDGIFLRNEFYHMELGVDYYYIYIPTKLVKNDSMLEIERCKLFDFHSEYTFSDETDYIELVFDGDLSTVYAHDVYIVDLNTNQYVGSSKIRMKIYSQSLQRWVDIDPNTFTLLGDRVVRIFQKGNDLTGMPLRIGVHKGTSMVTGEVYDKELYHIGDWMYVTTVNHGNYDGSDYRVFNNGKLLLPIQYQVEKSPNYGGEDSCRTNWALTKGDQITVDHVPWSIRTVYYQPDIPEDGLIDVDGKLNLPVNLKWYDIYVNGRRLHSKNIVIVSPTKFYVKGIQSRRHLIIFDRDRDNDVFFLSPHYAQDKYSIDRNDTIIDKLIHAGLRDIIALENDPIDNTEPDIGDPGVFGPGVLDAIVYFLLYLNPKYINCNYKLLPSIVKEKFKFFINPDGVMGVNANVHPSGVLYKVINCNKGVETMDKKLPDASIETGLRELQDRFAITPLHSSNYQFALKGEFICDPETGGTGIRHNDGTITLIDELNRKKEHIDNFEQKLILANIGRYSIYDAQFNDTSKVKTYFRGTNLLDNDILIERTNGEPIGKFALSVDTTVLQKTGDDDILRWSNHDPSVLITYYTQKDLVGEKTYRQVASRLGDRFIEDVDTPVLVITSIILELPDNAITEDKDNPDVENGDGIDLTKGVILDNGNYTSPELPEPPEVPEGDNDTETTPPDTSQGVPDDPECICPDEPEKEPTKAIVVYPNTLIMEPGPRDYYFDEEGCIIGDIIFPNNMGANTSFDISGNNQFMIHMQLFMPNRLGNDRAESICGKVPSQYGLQITSDHILAFGLLSSGRWNEMRVDIGNTDFYGRWHDIFFIFNGRKFIIYLDGVIGYVSTEHQQFQSEGDLVSNDESIFTIGFKPNSEDSNNTSFSGKIKNITMLIQDGTNPDDDFPDWASGIDGMTNPVDINDTLLTIIKNCQEEFSIKFVDVPDEDTETPAPPENPDDDLYKPIGNGDTSEYTEPMRCMVHSILIALKDGDLQL